MRILYVVTGSEYGGPSRHVIGLIRYMKEHGHEAGIVAAPEQRLMREAHNLGAKVYPNPYFVRPMHMLSDVLALKPVLDALREFKPDLVSGHSTKAGLASRFWCALLRVRPVIFTAHGWAFTPGKGGGWKQRALIQAERLAAKFSSKIICVSKYDHLLAQDYNIGKPDQVVVVHNGIDPELIRKAEGSVIRKELGIAPDELVLTMVARLVPQKDHVTLLQACRDVDNVRVLLVGDGSRRSHIEQLIARQGLTGRVTLLGEREDVPNILKASDIFVLATHWEGLPRAIIEAMMAHLPVIASRVGGVEELVKDGNTGILVPPEDTSALSKAISELTQNADMRKQMGQAGLEKSLHSFTLESMFSNTLKVYEDAMGQHLAA